MLCVCASLKLCVVTGQCAYIMQCLVSKTVNMLKLQIGIFYT